MDKTPMLEYARELLSKPFRGYVDEALESPRAKDAIAEMMVEPLMEAANNPEKCDANNYDILVSLAAQELRRFDPDSCCVPIQPWLAQFAADVLEGKRKRPTKRGPDKYGNFSRNYCYARAVSAVAERFEIPKYATGEPLNKPTAAEVIAEAAGCKPDTVINAVKSFKNL